MNITADFVDVLAIEPNGFRVVGTRPTESKTPFSLLVEPYTQFLGPGRLSVVGSAPGVKVGDALHFTGSRVSAQSSDVWALRLEQLTPASGEGGAAKPS